VVLKNGNRNGNVNEKIARNASGPGEGPGSLLKTVGIMSLSVIIFAVIYNALLGGPAGFGFPLSHGMRGVPASYDIVTSALGTGVKLLWVILLVSLTVALVTTVKKLLSSEQQPIKQHEQRKEGRT